MTNIRNGNITTQLQSASYMRMWSLVLVLAMFELWIQYSIKKDPGHEAF